MTFKAKTPLGKGLLYLAGVFAALITIIVGVNTIRPIAQAYVLEDSDPVPLASIERVALLEALPGKIDTLLANDFRREVAVLTETFLRNCRRIDQAAVEGTDAGDFRSAIARAQLRWMALHSQARYPLRESCL